MINYPYVRLRGLLTVFGILFMIHAYTQVINGSMKSLQDSISHFDNNNNLEGKLEFLYRQDTFYINQSNPQFISRLDKYFDMLNEFGKGNDFQLRKAFVYHARHYVTALGNYERAQHYYLQAYDFLEDKINGDAWSWYAENELGNIYSRQGDYENAFRYLKIVERQLLSKDLIDDKLGRLCTNMGRLFKSKGERTKAENYFKKGIKYGVDYDKTKLANHINLAEFYIEDKNIIKAEKHLNALNKLDQELVLQRMDFILELEGRIFQLKGEFVEADLKFGAALVELIDKNGTPYRRETSKLLLLKAQNLIQTGRLDEAEKDLNMAIHYLVPTYDTLEGGLPDKELIYPENTFIDLLSSKAVVYTRKYENGQKDVDYLMLSSKALDLAITTNDKLRFLQVNDASKLVNIRVNRRLVNKAIAIEYLKYSNDPGQESLERARQLMNHSKALLLRSKTDDSNKIRKMSGQDKNRMLAIRESLLEHYNLKRNIVDPDSIEQLYSKILDLEQEAQSIIRSFDDEPVRIPVFQKKYVEFLVTDTKVYSLNNISEEDNFVDHGNSERLVKLIAHHRDLLLKEGEEDSLRMVSHELYNFLLGDIKPKEKYFTVIPDDILYLLNFELLVADVTSGNYLIESHVISYAYHIDQLYTENKLNENRDIFCLSPQYGSAKTGNDISMDRSALYDLKFAEKEINDLLAIWSQTDNRASRVSKTTLSRLFREKSIFHYAGHARANDKEAYLALSSEKANVRLNYDEIELMNIGLDMVTLSACETALGEHLYGEGILSMARSFISAGAASVITSLWAVNDQGTSKLMSDFYFHLKKGKPKDEALQKAKLDFIESVQPKMRHPYYWAGFVAVGDMQAMAPNWTQNLVLVGVFLVVVVVMSVLILGRKNN